MQDTKQGTHLKGNYLSRLRSTTERRRFERRKCNFLARIFFTANGFHGITEHVATAVDISEGGVRLQIDHIDDLPKHFYLYVGHYQHGIGCAMVWRDTEQVRCEFIREEAAHIVDFLAEVSEPESTLAEIQHPYFGFTPGH